MIYEVLNGPQLSSSLFFVGVFFLLTSPSFFSMKNSGFVLQYDRLLYSSNTLIGWQYTYCIFQPANQNVATI